MCRRQGRLLVQGLWTRSVPTEWRCVFGAARCGRASFVLVGRTWRVPALIHDAPGVTLVTRKLEQVATVSESSPVKSGAFDEDGVFLYTTVTHMKYLLPTGFVSAFVVACVSVCVCVLLR